MLPSLALTLWALAAAGAREAAPPPRADLEAADAEVAAGIEALWQRAAESPESVEAWLALGQIYQAHLLHEPAIRCYEVLLRLDPGHPRAHYLLGLLEAESGNLERAAEAFQRAAELEPRYAPARWRLGEVLSELGRTPSAEEEFLRALEIDDQDRAGWMGLARVRFERNDASGARDALRRVLEIDPSNGVALQLLGRVQVALGDTDEGRRTLALSAGMTGSFPDPWQEEMVGAAAGLSHRLKSLSGRLERGETTAVIHELENLRRSYPDDVGLLNELAEAHLLAKDALKALGVLAIALRIDPDEFATLIHLGQAEKQRGDLEAAMSWAERAVEVNPRLWQAHFLRAGILHQTGRFRDCLAALETANSLGALHNPDVRLMHGDALLQLGEVEEAERVFEQATHRFPFLARAWGGLAVARTSQEKAREARQALQAARRLLGEDAILDGIEARLRELEATSERTEPDPTSEPEAGGAG